MGHRKITAAIVAFAFCSPAFAQKVDNKTWYQQDFETDSVYGISLKKAYGFLQNKKSTPIIVAVIDGGIDTTHEDLKSVLWTNPKEIAGNKKDDDKNGYVDDIHGWNFLGNANGKNVDKEAEEKYRVYYKYKERFAGKTIDVNTLSKLDKYEYLSWKRAADEVADPAKAKEDEQKAVFFADIYDNFFKADTIMQTALGKKEFTFDSVSQYSSTNNNYIRAKYVFQAVHQIFPNLEGSMSNTEFLSGMKEERDKYQKATTARQKAPTPYRQEVVQDSYDDFKDRSYGNGDIYGGDPMHGTHVSGIIAATRNNGIGIDGVADNVKILSVRAVPDGDEYDKDIALAIRYAVDNGAKVINMSFGKPFSP